MTRALVITHGEIGRELVRVTELIMGPVQGLKAMSNSGLSAMDITAQVKVWLEETPVDPDGVLSAPDRKLILLDDYGGSCATCAQLACEGDQDTALVSGVNLAMLLGFVTWRDDYEFAELAAKVVQKGREAILLVGGR